MVRRSVENHTVSTCFDVCAIFGTSLCGTCLYARRRSLYASPFLYSMTLIYIVYSYSTTSVTYTETEFDLIYTRNPRRHSSPGCFLSFLWPRGHMSPGLFLFLFSFVSLGPFLQAPACRVV